MHVSCALDQNWPIWQHGLASEVSELACGPADIWCKLFPLSWYIEQLCSAARKLISNIVWWTHQVVLFLIWTGGITCQHSVGDFTGFIKQLWLSREHQFISKISVQGFILVKFNSMEFSEISKFLLILRCCSLPKWPLLDGFAGGEKLRSCMVKAVNSVNAFPTLILCLTSRPGSVVWV